MKKYNMIENRPELSQKEVEEGMDFRKVLSESSTSSKSNLKLIAIISVVLFLLGIALFFLIDFQSTKNSESESKQQVPVQFDSLKEKSLSIETFTLFIGSYEAKGDLVISKSELLKVESLEIKSSVSVSSFKLVGFTFTTLTKNGISQINSTNDGFNKEIKDLINSMKVGQIIYIENIIVQDELGKKQPMPTVSISIK
jgi:flagellar basal body-associated protein FliL